PPASALQMFHFLAPSFVLFDQRRTGTEDRRKRQKQPAPGGSSQFCNAARKYSRKTAKHEANDKLVPPVLLEACEFNPDNRHSSSKGNQQSGTNAKPCEHRRDASSSCAPSFAHQQMADEEAVNRERDAAKDHRSCLCSHIIDTMTLKCQTKRHQRHRWCRTEQPCEALWPQKVAQQRKGRHDNSAGEEANDKFQNPCSSLVRKNFL